MQHPVHEILKISVLAMRQCTVHYYSSRQSVRGPRSSSQMASPRFLHSVAMKFLSSECARCLRWCTWVGQVVPTLCVHENTSKMPNDTVLLDQAVHLQKAAGESLWSLEWHLTSWEQRSKYEGTHA